MVAFLTKLLLSVRSRTPSQVSPRAEFLVLRHQALIISRKSVAQVRSRNLDRFVFVWLYRLFPSILVRSQWSSRRP